MRLPTRFASFVLVLGMLPAFAAAQDAVYLDAGRAIAVTRRSPRGLDGTSVVSLRPADGLAFQAGVRREALVELPAGASAEATARALGITLVREVFHARHVWLVRGASAEDGVDVAARLAPAVARGALGAAMPDLVLPRVQNDIAIPPSDPRYGGQWYLEEIEIERAWQVTDGVPEVVVSVIDNGCDVAHPDLAPKLEPGRDAFDGDDDPSYLPSSAGNEHGTACAGIVAAASDNGEGVAGTCPECRLRCIRLLPGDGGGVPISADMDAFDFVMSHGDPVVSNSWGLPSGVPVPSMLANAIRTVETDGRGGLGTLVVFAAGNDSSEIGPDELQAVEGVLTVGATTNFSEAAPFSNFGESVALTAPTGTLTADISGADGADPGDYTSLFSGTSSSCPVVAGVAGLLFSLAPEATADEVRAALVESARPAPFATPDAMGHDVLYGYGIVDPYAALRALRPDLVGEDAGVGPADGGGGAVDAGTVPPPSEGCGCRVVRAPEGSGSSFAGLFAFACAVALAGRRRRSGGIL